jgi:uncharacterized protein
MSKRRTPLTGEEHRHELLWQRLDGPGLDHCQTHINDYGASLYGSIIMTVANEPATLTYGIECDHNWHTNDLFLSATRASTPNVRRLHLSSEGDGRWSQVIRSPTQIAKRPLRQFEGLFDVDLAFSPVTNALPIQRLGLNIGESAEVTAIWIEPEAFALSSLQQRYTRLGQSTYRYESLTHDFTVELDVDNFGLVRSYPGLWQRIADGRPR